MIKRLTKHANGYAMVIDRAILELIQTTPDTPFEIISDGRSLEQPTQRGIELDRDPTLGNAWEPMTLGQRCAVPQPPKPKDGRGNKWGTIPSCQAPWKRAPRSTCDSY